MKNENEETVATGPSQEPQVVGRPRLGHLFVITTTCAFVAGLGRFCYDPSIVEAEHTIFAAIYWAVGSLLYGVAIGGAAVLVLKGRRQVDRRRLAPGHWLVLFFAVSLAVQFAAMAAGQVYASRSTDPFADYYGDCLAGVISGTGESGLCFLIAAQLAGERRWWTPFLICGISQIAVTLIFAMLFVGVAAWTWRAPLFFELLGALLIAGSLIKLGGTTRGLSWGKTGCIGWVLS